MTTGSLLREELTQAFGYETAPTVIEIDKTLISRYASAVGDNNPLWCDEERVKQGRIVAPPSLLYTALMTGTSPWVHLNPFLPPRGIDGGGELEYFAPVMLGDTISVKGCLLDIAERQSKLGPMLVISAELTYHNQRQELVAKAAVSVIRY